MDRQTILQAEHDTISNAYDWMVDKDTDAHSAIQYILGAHDLTMDLLNMVDDEKNTDLAAIGKMIEEERMKEWTRQSGSQS